VISTKEQYQQFTFNKGTSFHSSYPINLSYPIFTAMQNWTSQEAEMQARISKFSIFSKNIE